MTKNSPTKYESHGISAQLNARVKQAAETSWKHFGKKITFFLPGIFTLDGECGQYPAVSVTGGECELQCKHCSGKLLEPMPPARDADELLSLAERWKQDGVKGVLLSGGSTRDGYVPLAPLLPAVPELNEMGFYVSAHSGFAMPDMAQRLARAGVDQVLIDVVGDDATMRDVLNLPGGIAAVERALDALFEAELFVIPHIIIGLAGEICGERNALRMLQNYPIRLLSYVVLMPAVAMERSTEPIPIEQVLEIIVDGRELFPDVEQSLGCARPRGAYRYELEKWALRAGINRMALWSEDAISEAEKLGLQITRKYTCCSVGICPPEAGD